MQIERLSVEPSSPPFPIYNDATAALLHAHEADPSERDPPVAHILAVLAGYAYADSATFAMMASRLGMSGSACVRFAQTVESMLIGERRRREMFTPISHPDRIVAAVRCTDVRPRARG